MSYYGYNNTTPTRKRKQVAGPSAPRKTQKISLAQVVRNYLEEYRPKSARKMAKKGKSPLRTMTGVRRKKKFRVEDADSGIKKRFMSHTVYKFPKYKKGRAYPKWSTYEQASTFSYASSTGTVPGTNQLNRQKVFELQAFAKTSDLKNLGSYPYLNAVAGFQALDPQLQSTTLTGTMVYGGVRGSFEFSNQEQANLIGTIYMCVAKRNLETYTAPDVAWEAGLDEVAGPVRGTANVNTHMPNSSPTGKYFSDRWKIVGKQHFEMAAGLTYRLGWSYKCNKNIELSSIYSFAAIKDVTISFLVRMRGTPVDFDATRTHGPATLMGFAPSKIVGVASNKYWWKTVAAEAPNIIYQNNTISGTAPTVVYELNDEDGKPIDIFAATNVA